MKNYLIILLFSLIGVNAFSQEVKIDTTDSTIDSYEITETFEKNYWITKTYFKETNELIYQYKYHGDTTWFKRVALEVTNDEGLITKVTKLPTPIIEQTIDVEEYGRFYFGELIRYNVNGDTLEYTFYPNKFEFKEEFYENFQPFNIRTVFNYHENGSISSREEYHSIRNKYEDLYICQLGWQRYYFNNGNLKEEIFRNKPKHKELQALNEAIGNEENTGLGIIRRKYSQTGFLIEEFIIGKDSVRLSEYSEKNGNLKFYGSSSLAFYKENERYEWETFRKYYTDGSKLIYCPRYTKEYKGVTLIYHEFRDKNENPIRVKKYWDNGNIKADFERFKSTYYDLNGNIIKYEKRKKEPFTHLTGYVSDFEPFENRKLSMFDFEKIPLGSHFNRKNFINVPYNEIDTFFIYNGQLIEYVEYKYSPKKDLYVSSRVNYAKGERYYCHFENYGVNKFYIQEYSNGFEATNSFTNGEPKEITNVIDTSEGAFIYERYFGDNVDEYEYKNYQANLFYFTGTLYSYLDGKTDSLIYKSTPTLTEGLYLNPNHQYIHFVKDSTDKIIQRTETYKANLPNDLVKIDSFYFDNKVISIRKTFNDKSTLTENKTLSGETVSMNTYSKDKISLNQYQSPFNINKGNNQFFTINIPNFEMKRIVMSDWSKPLISNNQRYYFYAHSNNNFVFDNRKGAFLYQNQLGIDEINKAEYGTLLTGFNNDLFLINDNRVYSFNNDSINIIDGVKKTIEINDSLIWFINTDNQLIKANKEHLLEKGEIHVLDSISNVDSLISLYDFDKSIILNDSNIWCVPSIKPYEYVYINLNSFEVTKKEHSISKLWNATINRKHNLIYKITKGNHIDTINVFLFDSGESIIYYWEPPYTFKSEKINMKNQDGKYVISKDQMGSYEMISGKIFFVVSTYELIGDDLNPCCPYPINNEIIYIEQFNFEKQMFESYREILPKKEEYSILSNSISFSQKINSYKLNDEYAYFNIGDNNKIKIDLSTGKYFDSKIDSIDLFQITDGWSGNSNASLENIELTQYFIDKSFKISKRKWQRKYEDFLQDQIYSDSTNTSERKILRKHHFDYQSVHLNPKIESPNNRLIGIVFFDNAPLFYATDLYYMGTTSAIKNLSFQLGNKPFPLEQFDLKYNRPDIILDRLGYADSTLVQAYHQAYLKRLKKMGFTEEMLEDDFHLPEIKIENFEEMPSIHDQGSINLKLNLQDTKYKLDRINVWVNDVAVYGTNGISLRDKNVQEYTTNLEVFLAKGKNKIQVSVLNQAGAESYKETFEVECTVGKNQPDLYLISIGESEYQQSDFNLTYAAKDAKDIVNLFEKSKVYKNVYTKILVNEQVTKENILALKSFIENADINDEVMIFIAGHGVLDANLDYYFATYDMDFMNPSERGLAYEDLESLLDGIKPLKKTLLIDACHSGEIDKEEVELAQANVSEEYDIQFRVVGNTASPKLGTQNTSELTKSLFTDLRKGTGATVISSAGGMEFAMEGDNWNNGLFTYCFIKGIKTQAADLNKDGEIWLSEIQLYVAEQVSLLSGGRQQPTSRIENQTVDFRVW